MAFTRSVLNTGTQTAGVATFLSIDVAAPTSGDTWLAAIKYNNTGNGPPNGCTIGPGTLNLTMAEVISQTSILGGLSVYVYENLPDGGAPTSVYFDFGDAGDTGNIAGIVLKLTSDTGYPIVDKTASAGGTGTSPSSGATSTTADVVEFLCGIVGTEGPSGDTAGTWENSFAAGATNFGIGTGAFGATLSDGYLEVASTGAYTAAKTGITSRIWQAAIITFKILVPASGSTRNTLFYNLMRPRKLR